MKKPVKILLIVLLVLIAIAGVIAIVQRQNIKALMMSREYSSEELQTMISDEEEKRSETVKSISGLGVRELTDDEKKAVADGSLSSDEAVKRITGQDSNADDGQTQSEESTAPQTNAPAETASQPTERADSETDADSEIASLVGQIYVLEARYSGIIEGLASSAKAEYTSLPAEEHTTSRKYSIVAKYLAQASSQEASCDSEVASILNQMEKVLVASGNDTSLVEQIRDTYYSEKSLKKAYYMSQYS